jgi:L-threonylcarbamoyladenylate synthase
VAEAVGHLRAGEVVGMPTDTVYGIAADPHQPAAIRLIFTIKGRSDERPIGLLVASVEAALTMVELPAYAREWARRYWPGPLTLVATSPSPLPAGVGNHSNNTVGVRVPDHPTALALLAAAGPLAVTSANRSGEPEAVDATGARLLLGDTVRYYLPGSCPGERASTVIDVTGPAPVLLRRGPVEPLAD